MELILRDINKEVDKILQYEEIINHAQSKKPRPRKLLFVTSNQHKVKELSSQLQVEDLELSNIGLDIAEIQHTDPLVIAQDKCLRAFSQIRSAQPESTGASSAILVEDVCLNFKSMNGLPGPYIKWFVDSLKPVGLYKMLIGFEDKSAEAVCTYAYMENPHEVVFCRGLVEGTITEPRGESWGWDPVFEEPKSRRTYAEMDVETKSKCSHRSLAINVLREYLKSRPVIW